MKKIKSLTPEELAAKIENDKALKVLLKEALIDLAKIWGVWGTAMFTAIIGLILCFAEEWIFPWAMISLLAVFFVSAIMGYLTQRDYLKYKVAQKKLDHEHELAKMNKEK